MSARHLLYRTVLAGDGLKVLDHQANEQFRIAAAQRDPALFAELYECNFARVYAYVARRVSTRQDAEDMTSEVFHEALRNLDQFEWRGIPFAAWLIGIAARRIANQWRRNGKHAEITLDESELAGIDGDAESAALLSQLVEALPTDQKSVIHMRFLQQKSLRDIAAELGRSEGAIKQLQFRALQSLRSRMRKHHV